MWIKTTDSTRGFTDPETGERVEFNKNGKAQVSSEVGKKLVKKYDALEPTKDKTKKSEVKDVG